MLPEADYYLGCDVAKASLMYRSSMPIVRNYGSILSNEAAVIATFLLTLTGAYPNKQLQVVVEATGTYHYALAEASHAVGIPCRVYNPIITKSAIKASVRGKKTDRTDALIIARMGLRGEGRLYVPEPYMKTKHYARSCQKLSILSSSFRQYKQHFTELLGSEVTLRLRDYSWASRQPYKKPEHRFTKTLHHRPMASYSACYKPFPGLAHILPVALLAKSRIYIGFPAQKS